MSVTLRRLMLLLLLFGLLGTSIDLFLLGHYEDWRQRIPLVAFGVGGAAAVFAFFRPSAAAVRTLRWIMIGFVAAGLAGLYYHYTGNAEFELEMRPSMAGLELIWEALRGATPALAPGTLVQFGLLGLLYTYKHPALDELA